MRAQLFVFVFLSFAVTIGAHHSLAESPMRAGIGDALGDFAKPIIDFAKSTMVKYEMSSLAKTIQAKAYGKNIIPTPENFRQYVRDSMQSSRDPSLDLWDMPYKFERKGKLGVIVSYGPDKKKGTSDDIRHEVDLP